MGCLAGIVYAKLILQANKLLIEGDSSTVISWIQSQANGAATHLLLQDINLLFDGVALLEICHVYRKANLMADWVALYITQHSRDVIWTCIDSIPGLLRCILFFDLMGCIHTKCF